MKKITGLLLGILVLLVMVPAPVTAGDFPVPASGSPDPGMYAISAGPVVTAVMVEEPSGTQAPVKVMAVKVTTTPAGGVLMVGSVPSGASAYVDGTLKGTTPLTLSSIPIGSHTVTFRKAGYSDFTTTVTVTAGAIAKVTGTLVPVTTVTITRTTVPPVSGTKPVTVTGRAPVPARTTISATVPKTAPLTATRTTQQVPAPPTSGCTRHYYSGSGETGPAPDGRLTCTVIISTGDGVATLSIPEGTQVTGAGKLPVPMIHIAPVIPGEIPYGALPDGSQWTGRAYHFLPDGASFDPPVIVAFTLGRNEWEQSDPANVTIMESGGSGQEWEPLSTQMDPATLTLYAPVRHFSIIGLFQESPSANPPVTRQSEQSPLDLIRTATGHDHGPLPLSTLIPDAYAPLAAVAAGVVLSAAAVTAGGGMLLSRGWDRILDLIGQFFGSEATGFLNTAEIEKRGIRPAENLSAVLLGLSPREMLVIGITALGFAAAFILQDRLELELTTLIIFVCAGGIATILHDLAHKFAAYRTGCITEYRFWGLGTVTMFITAWLFGNAFAKPSRNLIRSGKALSLEEAAVIRLVGPIMSLALAAFSLFLIPLGGLFVVAGSAGFTMNLLNGVFSLVPVAPNDGVEIYAWNRVIWACVFIPLIAFYLYIYTSL